tara:strand:- start:213 stop:335 length:123 start_codon:yes stop_codon:yes gene_type:complete
LHGDIIQNLYELKSVENGKKNDHDSDDVADQDENENAPEN